MYKNFEDMGTVCHENDVEISVFCQKNYAQKKMPIFLLQLLSLPVLEIVCFLEKKKREKNIFASKSLILLITGMGGRRVSGGSFHEDNGLHLLLLTSEEDQRRKRRRKSFVNFKMPPKC